MYNEKWKYLKKNVSQGYELNPYVDATNSSLRVNITQLAFDSDDTRLIAVDSKGSVYYVEISHECPQYCKLGVVGLCTFVAFNPIDKSEILVGLTSSDVKILKLDTNITPLCLLSGHKYSPTSISFYKYYGLTFSHKEVIIWNLVSCCKVHQLHHNLTNVTVKKAIFSNLGLVAVLYENGTIQTWIFKRLNADTKIDAKTHGFNNVKDFIFTTDGRAMIIAGLSNRIIVLNTFNWNLVTNIDVRKNFVGARQLAIVPQPLDGGANKIMAILSSNCILQFLDLSSFCLIETLFSQPITGVRKIAVSLSGRYVAYIDNRGSLIVMNAENLLSLKSICTKKAEHPRRLSPHHAEDHLLCIRRSLKQELKLRRLIPILKQFGEYSQKHRAIIWITILKLPVNRNAFVALTDNVPWKKSLKLLKNYHLVDRGKASMLSMTIHYLLRWCPLLAHSTFLPRLVFPFIVVFQKNPLLTFEVILYLLLNYCQKWFEYHPLPPINVLGIAENVLLEADPYLLKIFCERGITSNDYVWPLLQTIMSEVLSGIEWLILWDHLWSFRRPSLLLMCVIAYSICARQIIISQLHSPKDLRQFYSSQGHIKAKDLLEVALRLDHDTPLRMHPNRYLRNKIYILPAEGPYPCFLSQDYPKFLTEESQTTRLDRLQKYKQVLQQHRRLAMKLMEEKRISSEMKNFMKQIHETRMKALQKCYDEQIRNKELQLENTWKEMREEGLVKLDSTYDDILLNSTALEFDDVDRYNEGTGTTNVEQQTRDYENLQNGVQRLETEIQTLLRTKSMIHTD